MPSLRHILCSMATTLLLVTLFIGTAASSTLGTGASICTPACPCDAPDAPSDEHCPDDCQGCRCSLARAAAVISHPMLPTVVPATPTPMRAPPDAPQRAACTGVFRPPRA